MSSQNKEGVDSPTSEGHGSSPTATVNAIISLLIAILGSQAFTGWAPPTANSGILRSMLIGAAAVAWVLGLMILSRWKNESNVSLNRRRIISAALAVVLLAVIGTRYLTEWEEFTVEFAGARVLTGTELTTVGLAYFAKHMDATRSQAVAAAGGNAEDVWTISSINWKRSELLAYFLSAAALAVFCVIILYYSLIHLAESKRLKPSAPRK